MPDAIVITPVKDSLETTRQTIASLSQTTADVEYYVFNDFSAADTRQYLEQAAKDHGFELIHLEEITQTPSPNYKLVLEIAQQKALKKKCPLIIVESDVIVQPETISSLLTIARESDKAGMVGAITVDRSGAYNFPYTFEKTKSNSTVNTTHSLSFCCTLITHQFLSRFNFHELDHNKDWFDVFISRQSRRLGFNNYLAKGTEVIHLPHSSRPWKNLKYKNPLLYYLKKVFLKRDRI